LYVWGDCAVETGMARITTKQVMLPDKGGEITDCRQKKDHEERKTEKKKAKTKKSGRAIQSPLGTIANWRG